MNKQPSSKVLAATTPSAKRVLEIEDSEGDRTYREETQQLEELSEMPSASGDLASEISEQLISQSLLKRRGWAKKYRVPDRTIFALYSEFSSMIMIAKADGRLHKRNKSFSGVVGAQSSTPAGGNRGDKLNETL